MEFLMDEFPNREYVQPKKSLAEWKAEAADKKQHQSQPPTESQADQLAEQDFQRNLREGNIR